LLINPQIDTNGESDYVSDFWKTREESLDGLCDVLYQVNELPHYMIKERSEKIPNGQLCPQGSKYFEIVKTRDVNSCVKRSSFSFYKPGFYRCPTGNCDGMWTRSSLTRYIACGSSRRDLRVQYIYNEGELQQNLLGFKTEKFLTGTKQELKLVDERQSSGSKGQDYPSNPITKNELFYEYGVGFSKQQNQQQDSQGQQEAQIKQEALHGATSLFKLLPRSILANGGSISNTVEGQQGEKFSPKELVPKIKTLFQKLINEDLVKFEGIPEKQVTMKTLTLARGFSILDKETLHTIYNDLKSQFSNEDQIGMFKNIFVDTVLMGGSTNNILFIKDLMTSGELNTIQMVSFFTFLPHYVVSPTRTLLHELYELVSSSHIKQNFYLYNHAILGYSNLLERACLAENRDTSYPTFVFGEFCEPDSEIIVMKWIPFLQRELQEAQSLEKKNVVLVALGLLSHKNVIPVVTPIIENNYRSVGQQVNDVQASRLTRFLAVYALGRVAARHTSEVTPIMNSIFSNQAENTEIRIAAFNVLMRSNPSTTVLHKIATLTWQERDQEVLFVVNTAFYSLSQQQDVQFMPSNSLQRKVWLVYPLIKKTSGKYPTSGSIYSAEYLRGLGIGYYSVNGWIGSRSSVIPSDVYQRVVYILDKYQFTPVEMALRLRGVENVVSEVLEVIAPSSTQESGFEGQIEQQIHKEWRQVIEELKIKTRQEPDTEFAIFLNLFEDSPMFYSFQAESKQMLRQKVSKLLRGQASLQQTIEDLKYMNFQKVFDINPSEFSIPSDMGLPIVIEIHMPVTVSLRGKIDVQMSQNTLPRLQMDVKTLFASQLTGWVGTICPFTNEYTVTGIDEHSVVAIPAQFNVDMNLPEGKVDVALTSLPVNNPIDIVHFHIRPFTVFQKLWTLEPMTLSSNIKFIKSRSEEKTISYSFGEYLGLNMKSMIKTESTFADFRTVMQKMRMFNFNPMNILRFGWASGALDEYNQPSLRKHEIQLKYDPSGSSTREIRFQVQMSTGIKQDQQSPVKVHKIVHQQSTGKINVVLTEPQQTHEKKMSEQLERIQVSYWKNLP
jgi:hypothetical protein